MVTEQDIELLELYHDGELSAEAAADLERRLATEPELTLAQTRLTEARQQRLLMFRSLEPADNAAADRIVEALRKKQERRAWYMAVLDNRERIAAAAACIAVFMIGWQWGRNGMVSHLATGGTSTVPVSLITQQQVPVGKNMVFEVRVTDPAGQVRVERFSTLQEAQSYIQQIQNQMQQGK